MATGTTTANKVRTSKSRDRGRELWALRKTGWRQAQIAEVNRYIEKLMHVMAVPGRNGRLYAVTIVLTPLSRRSHRHDEQTLSL